MPSHDNSYKQLFSFPLVVRDLLRGYVHEPWVADVALHSLTRASGSYVADDLRDREDDIVWRVQLDDRAVYVYLLLEFQRSDDPWMAVRILTYVGLLYQDLIKGGVVKRGGKLPAVFPAVIYNGDQPWRSARQIGDLIEATPASLARYRPSQAFFLLDEQATEEGAEDNLVSDIIALESWPSAERFAAIVAGLRKRLAVDENRELRRALAVWLRRLILPKLTGTDDLPPLEELEELEIMLTEKRLTWPERWKEEGVQQGMQQGMQQGRQEGMQQGQAALLEAQLERRFGPLSEMHRSRLQQASSAELGRWALALLDVDSIDEVFADQA